jgi:hypothetical protein
MTVPEQLEARRAAERIIASIQAERKVNTPQVIEMRGSNTFRDVHYYDGKLEEPFIPSRQFSIEEKTHLFQSLIKRFQHPIAINMVNLISQAMGGFANLDNKNNVDSSDVLAEICIKDLDESMIFFLQEQLVDNFQLGQCPQGRSWRLLQIYRTVINMEEEKNLQDDLDNKRKLLDALLQQAFPNGNSDMEKKCIGYFLTHDPPQRIEMNNAIHHLIETGNPQWINEILSQS